MKGNNMEQIQADLTAYKCPNCGAALGFDAGSGDFACAYCGSHFSESGLESIQGSAVEDFSLESIDNNDFEANNLLYSCPNCGAEVVVESELSASAICHYCHTPIVLSGRLTGEYRPDVIIPFMKTKEDALAGFAEWISKRKFFLAKGFGSPDSLEKIQGIYVPYWLADCIVEGNLECNCSESVSSVRRDDYVINTENEYFVVREGTLEFANIPADGSARIDDALMESIEPFDYSKLVDFKMAYLAGHKAEKYDVPKEKVYPAIEKRACEATKAQFYNSVRKYDKKNIKHESYQVKGIRWRHAMMPMWFLSYKYKGKMYYYVMNGENGLFGGILPINKAKLAFFSFGIPGAIVLLLGIISGFFGGWL